MKRVPLYKGVRAPGSRTGWMAEFTGEYAMVDDEDFPKVMEFVCEHTQNGLWYLKDGKKTHYAHVMLNKGSGQKHIMMHHVVIGQKPGDGEVTDHINRNGLDNRRDNLRIVTHSESNYNRDYPSRIKMGDRSLRPDKRLSVPKQLHMEY